MGWKSLQEKRTKDFEERKFDEVKNYFATKGFDSEFVAVHPMADEDWWFEKFKKNREICKSVDLYWKFDGDVAFVQIFSSCISGTHFSARWKKGLYLQAKVRDGLISSKTVDFVLESLWRKHLENNLFQKYYLKRKYHHVK